MKPVWNIASDRGPRIIPLKIKKSIDGSFNLQDKNCETIAKNNIKPDASKI
ncbi:hypothetical protein FNFX1_0137 [Francisella cf. novicida Fx1]|nr:hypothetical protein FNFX1_0137 [Francisella cf. novicida Fx1]